MNDAVLELIDEACRARQAAVTAAKRSHKERMVAAAFDSEFADELAQAYSDLTPSAPTRAYYAEIFQLFRSWVSADGLSALPAIGPVVGNYLIRLALDGEPLSKIRQAADAIRYYHSAAEVFFDEAYAHCTLEKIIKHMNPDDDGGGQPVPLRPITTTIASEMPLAAAGGV
jgi:hypothetical protein